MTQKIYICLCLLLSAWPAWGQNPHLSLLLEQPLYTNPALLGQFKGRKRFQLAHRRQWPTLAAPYTTRLAAGEWRTSKLGIGGIVVQDKTNGLGLDYLHALMGIAGGVGNEKNRLQAGIQIGFIQQSFDPQNFSFDNQYISGSGYNPELPTGEWFDSQLNGLRQTAASLCGGLSYTYSSHSLKRLEALQLGVSWHHMNRPQLGFQAHTSIHPIRSNLSFYSLIRLNERLRMRSTAIWMRQQQSRAFSMSNSWEYECDQEVFLEAGLGYRSRDAFFPFMRLHLNQFQISFAYDLNISSLALATKRKGGAEISLTYLIREAPVLSNYEQREQAFRRKKTEDKSTDYQIDTDSLGINDRDGDGIVDHQDACPDQAGLLAYRGCPDQDFDGLPDHMDRCPDEAGPRERAGCPVSDIDADGDEIPDKLDACPYLHGLAELHGCPAPIDSSAQPMAQTHCGCEQLTDAVKLRQRFGPYEFDTDQSHIRPQYFAELSLLAREMQQDTYAQLLIEGHTDAEGNVSYNLLLGKARAQAISHFLISRGVQPQQITQVSYGELIPKNTNKTPAGKAQNRRVEVYLYQR